MKEKLHHRKMNSTGSLVPVLFIFRIYAPVGTVNSLSQKVSAQMKFCAGKSGEGAAKPHSKGGADRILGQHYHRIGGLICILWKIE